MLRTDLAAGAEPAKAKRDAAFRLPEGPGAAPSPTGRFPEFIKHLEKRRICCIVEPASGSADSAEFYLELLTFD